jgi:hypothetical protein
MPFKSKAQAKLMYAVAGDKGLAKQLGIPQSVAKKMTKDDTGYKNKPAKVKKK